MVKDELLNKKYQHWQNQLLDLGKRNKMIQFRETKYTTLKLVEPSFEELFKRIVLQEEELSFQRPIDRNSDIRTYSILKLLEILSSPIEVNIGDIKADGTFADCQKTLKQMRSKAKLALDEQGTNILYMVVGFVEWREKNTSDAPWIKSPLILVPVSLTLESLNAPYVLKKYEDDVVVNPTVAYLFKRDYGIILPSFDAEEQSIFDFMEEMDRLVDKRGWRIVREVSLGLVSFLKISMYEDLERNEQNIKNSAIIRAFAGEKNEISVLSEEICDFDHDLISSIDNYQVVNADSSQQDAILLSQKGVSFVMQGPPGTGKSQTITNIIAQGLADGKKILFVSEKMAALEVVHKKLTEVNLADFCLDLHSYKANKKEVLAELGKNLELKKFKVKDEEIAKLTELDVLKENLKNYIKDIHTKIMPLEMSLYEVYGKIMALRDYIDFPLDISSPEICTKEQVNRYALMVSDFDKAKSVLGTKWYKNPWQGTVIHNVTYELTKRIKETFYRINHILNLLEKDIEEIFGVTNIEFLLTMKDLELYEELVELCKVLYGMPLEWLKEPVCKEYIDISQNNLEFYKQVQQIKADLIKVVKEDFFEFDAEEEILKLQNAKIEIEKRICSKYSSWEYMLSDFIKKYRELDKNYILLNSIIKAVNTLKTIYSIEFEKNIYSLQKYASMAEILSQRPFALYEWFDCDKIRAIRSLVVNYEKEIEKKNILYTDIIEKYDEKLILNISENKIIELENIKHYIYFEKVSSYNKNQLAKSLNNIQTQYKEIKELLEILEGLFVADFEQYGISIPKDAKSIPEFILLLEALHSDIKPTYVWTDETQRELYDITLSECERRLSRFQNIQNILIEKWDKSVYEIDSKEILHRYKTEYTGIFKIFKKSYWQDTKTLKGCRKELGKKVSVAEAMDLLLQLQELEEIRQWFEEKKEVHQNVFGEKYNGIKTDWNLLKFDKEKFDAAYSIKGVGSKILVIIKQCGEKEQAQAFLAKDYWSRLYEKLTESDNREIFEQCSIADGMEQFDTMLYILEVLLEYIEKLEVSKNFGSEVNVEELVRICEVVKEYRIAIEKIKQMYPQLEQSLGVYFKKESTDFNTLYKNIDFINSLCDILKIVPEDLKNIIVEQSYDKFNFEYTKDSVDKLINEIEGLIVFSADEEVDVILNRLKETMFQIEEIQTEYELLNRTTQNSMSADNVFNSLMSLKQVQLYENMIEKEYEKYKKMFGSYFKGMNTEWQEILKVLHKTATIHDKAEIIGLSDEHLKLLLQTGNLIERNWQNVHMANSLKNDIEWVYSLFEETMDMSVWSFQQYNRKIKSCLESIETLEAWIDFRDCGKICNDNGLGSFISATEDNIYEGSTLDKIFYKAFYLKWLAAMMPNVETVANFRARIQNNNVQRFRQLDGHQFPVAQMRIREKLIAGLPDANNFNKVSDEMSILVHELGKKRKIMPLRKLFRAIPNLLLKLKPCLMMSPLSVSYFLEAKTYKFDMVIFDEASQIFPQDAIGAIFRGSQVIISGDSKQLPPTNFFAASTNNDSDYDVDDENAEEVIYDSILEEATNSLPNHSLLWHYRSKNEDLISFSNQEIYQNKLITFPSSVTKAADSGVEYVYVEDGVYEDRCNILEAKKCVELVRQHIIKHPKRSLGIIAFSEKQQAAIENEINKFRIENPIFEEFFNENKDEAFFVKNLENVQGDERDTILFSICYAKDANGKMYMRFGPLGHQGGERRLNVAITRAKENIKLVGSILPSDINLEKIKSEGVKMLRSYIEFALYGNTMLKKRKNPNSLYNKDEFVNGVAELLVNYGYKVYQNVGNSDYTIDIAIEHPKYEKCFVAGIECDGEFYYMARTVRDREHLRTAVLEQMGWKMYRVWSTEWINNFEGEKTRLLNFINDAIEKYQNQEQKQEIKLPERKEHIATEEVIEKIPIQEVDTSNPYGFKYYEIANWYDAPRDSGNDSISQAAAMIYYIVKIEQPIHIEMLYRRMAGAYSNEKVTKTVRESVNNAIRSKLSGKVKIIKDFVILSDLKDMVVRIPKGNFKRDIEYISKQEIAKAMIAVLENSVGIEKKQLIFETARIFGFDRAGNKIATNMKAALDFLIEKGKVRILDEKVQLVEG